MRAFSVSYFHPAPTFHLHKSTQTITSSHEYKAITDSLRVEIILTLLWRRWYNYHANLAHQQFKTLSVIMSRIKTPTKKKERKKEGRRRGGGRFEGSEEKRNYARTSSHYNRESDASWWGAIAAVGGYYLPQVSNGRRWMQDGQHGPAVVQEPDVVLLVEDLLRRGEICKTTQVFFLLFFCLNHHHRVSDNTALCRGRWRLTCLQLFPASDVMNMPALAEDSSVPVLPAECKTVNHPRVGGWGKRHETQL